MDAVKYIKVQHGMCDAFFLATHTCKNCPLSMDKNGHNNMPCAVFRVQFPEEAVAIVEKWEKENEK